MLYQDLATNEVTDKTVAALKENGMVALVVENGAQAKAQVLKMIPPKAEVMTMTSVTLETIGIPSEINESGKYDSIRKKLASMDREKDHLAMNKLGGAPDYTIRPFHALT